MTAPRTEPSAPTEDRGRLAKAMICEETTRVCAARCEPAPRAIVLTGSLARDEATFIEEGTSWRLLGDADFFLVFHRRTRLPSQIEIDAATREIEEALRKRGLVAEVGLAPVDTSYLEGLPNHISPYELRSCGQVVWGDGDILSHVPEFAPAQISLEDAWRLLANRIIELVEVVASEGDVERPQVQYRVVKLFLDMATSYLVFAGRYCPTYRGREQALRSMAGETAESSGSPFPLRSFAERVSTCTRFKTEGCGLTAAPVELWEDAVRFGRLLWRWELARLTGAPSHLEASALMSRWMDLQPMRAKVHGWASLLRRSGSWRSWRDWSRWARLAWRASPRYWVYAAAADVFSRSTDGSQNRHEQDEGDFDWKPLLERLPMVDRRFPGPCSPSWRRAAQLVALNYRGFLETTVA